VRYRYPQKIATVGIDNTTNWRHKHLQALATHYRRAPHFERYISVFEEIYASRWESIAELNLGVIKRLREMLGIGGKPDARASTLDCSEEPTDRLIDICRALGADTYLAGAGGAAYMDLARFEQRGVRVATQRFEDPVYPQAYAGFEPRLSVVDLIFNCGPQSAEVIRGAQTGFA
jgi:hypothetical protein